MTTHEATDTTKPAVERRTVSVWDDQISLGVQVKGNGPPLVYLHPAGGMSWDGFLDDLARDHTVLAPEFPGTTPGDPMAIHSFDDIFDVILIYEEAMRALDAVGAPVVGQSFGGMLAAELASTFPELFSHVVLADPAGLWLDDAPAPLDFMAGPPEAIPGLLFHDPSCEGAQAMFTPPDDPEAAVEAQVGLVWALGCTAKLLWPIPDRGLAKRLHRLSAPALILWGEQDGLIPVAYGHEFARLIPDAQLEIVPNCGHIPQVEQPGITTEVVRRFLRA